MPVEIKSLTISAVVNTSNAEKTTEAQKKVSTKIASEIAAAINHSKER